MRYALECSPCLPINLYGYIYLIIIDYIVVVVTSYTRPCFTLPSIPYEGACNHSILQYITGTTRRYHNARHWNNANLLSIQRYSILSPILLNILVCHCPAITLTLTPSVTAASMLIIYRRRAVIHLLIQH